MTNATMIVSARSSNRYGFKCSCCKLAGPAKMERRTIKRKERTAFKAELAKGELI